MIEPDAPWPTGPVDVDQPTPWPPAEYPPEWPAGADPGYVLLEATWGDSHCQWLLERCRDVNAGIAGEDRETFERRYTTHQVAVHDKPLAAKGGGRVDA